MNVNPLTGWYRCWSCGEKGDIFGWVMKTQNVDFKEALRRLAQQAGVTLSRARPEASEESKSESDRNRRMMDAALAFFRAELPKSSVASAYCKKRGLDEAVIAAWEIGYAPDVGEALAAHLKKEGYPLGAAKDLFLVDGDAERGYGDKFKGRLIFPIRDERGQVVAFGGRLLGDGHPKYINSSDTPLYRKSRVLYGLWQSREGTRVGRHAILAEGYIDVIACHRGGLNQAVASLGTSLAEDQARLLKRWADKVTILYDGDAPGLKAADRAAEILEAEGLTVDVATVPAGDDPDTVLGRDGADALKKYVKTAVSPLDFRVTALERQVSASDPAFWAAAFELLAKAPTELEIIRQVERLAPKYPGVSDVVQARKSLRNEVMKLRPRARGARPGAAVGATNKPSRSPIDSAELTLIEAYLTVDERGPLHGYVSDPTLFTTECGRRISLAIATTFTKEAPIGAAQSWLDKLGTEIVEEIADLDYGRLGPFTEEFVSDAIQKLERARIDREHRATETPAERMRKTQERLAALKPKHPRDVAEAENDSQTS